MRAQGGDLETMAADAKKRARDTVDVSKVLELNTSGNTSEVRSFMQASKRDCCTGDASVHMTNMVRCQHVYGLYNYGLYEHGLDSNGLCGDGVYSTCSYTRLRIVLVWDGYCLYTDRLSSYGPYRYSLL